MAAGADMKAPASTSHLPDLLLPPAPRPSFLQESHPACICGLSGTAQSGPFPSELVAAETEASTEMHSGPRQDGRGLPTRGS